MPLTWELIRPFCAVFQHVIALPECIVLYIRYMFDSWLMQICNQLAENHCILACRQTTELQTGVQSKEERSFLNAHGCRVALSKSSLTLTCDGRFVTVSIFHWLSILVFSSAFYNLFFKLQTSLHLSQDCSGAAEYIIWFMGESRSC